jgi:hypothetical protein
VTIPLQQWKRERTFPRWRARQRTRALVRAGIPARRHKWLLAKLAHIFEVHAAIEAPPRLLTEKLQRTLRELRRFRWQVGDHYVLVERGRPPPSLHGLLFELSRVLRVYIPDGGLRKSGSAKVYFGSSGFIYRGKLFDLIVQLLKIERIGYSRFAVGHALWRFEREAKTAASD